LDPGSLVIPLLAAMFDDTVLTVGFPEADDTGPHYALLHRFSQANS